ncbi:MAG: S24 family peptidase [Bacteroidales bacterium]|nr:S24 family peptidase [Bacteroidales bacterium]
MECEEPLRHRNLESLKEGQLVAIVPQGISMLPFIRGGEDCVYLLKREKIEVGDIVLAVYQGRHLLHRVYTIEGERITLMGDGNIEGKELVTTEDVLGTAVDIVTHNGRHHKPKKAWLWRKLLPLRKYLLKLHRKWNKVKKTIIK